jgi:hypothetical protein
MSRQAQSESDHKPLAPWLQRGSCHDDRPGVVHDALSGLLGRQTNLAVYKPPDAVADPALLAVDQAVYVDSFFHGQATDISSVC